MRKRALLIALYTIALLALCVALKLPATAWVALVLGTLPGTRRQIPAALRFAIELVLIGLVILFVHSPWALGLQIVMSMAALSIARAEKPPVDRVILGSLLLAIVAAFIKPETALAFIPLAALAVLALVEGSEGSPDTARERMRLAGAMAAIVAIGALLLAVIARVMPWQSALAVIFSALAYPFLKLASYIHRRPAKHRITGPSSHPGQSPHAHQLVTHAPRGLVIVAIIAGVLLAAVIVITAYRHWGHNETLPGDDAKGDRGIVRETLSDLNIDVFGRRRPPRTPVRRLVHTRLRLAGRRQAGRKPTETLREWLSRHEPSTVKDIPTIYEEIRYGDAEDTTEKHRRVSELWPRWHR